MIIAGRRAAASTSTGAATALALLGGFAAILGWTPLGAAWAVPGDAAAGDWGAALLQAAHRRRRRSALLWLAWQAPGRTDARHARPRSRGQAPTAAWAGSTGCRTTRSAPSPPAASPTGAATRATGCRCHDPDRAGARDRCRSSIAGVPFEYLALVPVPLMCVFLGWTLHNDVAYDHTAIWLHVVSGHARRRRPDRPARAGARPSGIPLIGLGSAISIALYGDWAVLPAMLGVSTCILLAGLGLLQLSPRPGSRTRPRSRATARSRSRSPPDTAAALIQSLDLRRLDRAGAAGHHAAPCSGIIVDPIWHHAALYWRLRHRLVVVLVVGVVAGLAHLRASRPGDCWRAAIRT